MGIVEERENKNRLRWGVGRRRDDGAERIEQRELDVELHRGLKGILGERLGSFVFRRANHLAPL